jgi:hypothetical protein
MKIVKLPEKVSEMTNNSSGLFKVKVSYIKPKVHQIIKRTIRDQFLLIKSQFYGNSSLKTN